MTRPSTLRGAPGLLVTLFVACLTPALAACGASTRDTVLSCTAPSDCGPAALCVQGACQASTRPVADFTSPATLTTNRAVAVTATVHDPDPGDSVATWAWSVTRLAADCDADADVADAATLQAVFWCAGTYQISLVVSDSTGVESEPARRTVTVTALPDAPTVTAGAARTVEHRCAGAPLRCELEQPVALSAAGQSPLGGVLTYQWTAIPPDASRAGAAAGLSPSATARDATLNIETEGGPISGAWRFRVRVSDGSGNLAQATQLLTVGNRPPVIDGAPISLDHRYEDGAYVASGTLTVPVYDPDGDPLEVGVAMSEPSGSGCASSFTEMAAGTGLFSLSCANPLSLTSAPRALQATAGDVNGAEASVPVVLEIRNRLPVVQPAAGPGAAYLTLDHSVGTCPGGSGLCFQVGGPNPFVAIDPDGDPVSAITLLPRVEPARTASVAELGAGASADTFRFSTPVGLPAEFRSPAGASGFSVTATTADPFGASAPSQPLFIQILNRPPAVRTSRPVTTVAHRYLASASEYQATAPLAVFEDPDGDPLVQGGSVGDQSCPTVTLGADGAASVACRRAYQPAPTSPPTLSGFAGTHQVTAVAGDGWETTGAVTAVTIAAAPPTVPSYSGAVESCACKCREWDPEPPAVCIGGWGWAAGTGKGAFPVRPADPDGDPLAVTFSLAAIPPASIPTGASVTPAAMNGLPESSTTTVASSSFPVRVVVSVSDGVSQATATWTATDVSCSKAGQNCQ